MTNEECVRLLYHHLLGREVDPEGLKAWTALAEKEGSVNRVIEGIVKSAEFVSSPITSRVEVSRAGIEINSGTEILSAAKIHPINESHPSDVFVAGYPKSGITWIQYLLAGLTCGVDASSAPDTLVQALVPDVGYQKFYMRFATPTFFRTHFLPQSSYRRVIYLVRDGRDVMVSYFSFP